MKKEILDHYYKDVFPYQSKSIGLSLQLTLVHKDLFNKSCALLEEKYGLTHSETDVLATLYFNGKTLRPTELYEATIFSSGGMTKILKKLEEKQLIDRIPSKEDKRSMLVQIKPEGENIVLEAVEEMTILKDALFDHLDSDESQQLEKILKKLTYKIFDK